MSMGVYFFLGFLILQSVAHADKPFLRIENFHPRQVLLGPPRSGSIGEKDDLSILLKLQNERSAAQCSQANIERTVNMDVFFGVPRGPFSPAEAVCLSPLFDRLLTELRPFLGKAKDEWNRKRPYEISNQIKPCVPLETSAAYPSGHAVLATVVGLTLKHLYPARMLKIRSRVEEISHNRMLSGLHYPTDCNDGKKLGEYLFYQLTQNPRFLAFAKNFRCGPTITKTRALLSF